MYYYVRTSVIDDEIRLRGNRTHARFGSSLAVENRIDGAAVACGPNMKIRKSEEAQVVGVCGVWKKNKLAMFSTRVSGPSFGGFSAHFVQGSKDEVSDLLLGVPGEDTDLDELATGQSILYNIEENKRDIRVVKARVLTTFYKTNDTYSGYSVTSGRFKRGQIMPIFGSPRWSTAFNRTEGAVTVFGHSGNNEVTFNGEQVGEYFGYSVLVLDIDNDSQDDLLLVGSPFYYAPGGVEQGRVTIIRNKDGVLKLDKRFDIISRSKTIANKARFGTALANIGDINQDGFIDIAVGAPLEEDEGAVYIYLGLHDGNTDYSQRITPSKGSMMYGFGFSIAGGVDVDDNSVSDIAVGSFQSNRVMLIKSYPVVRLQQNLASSVQELSIHAASLNVSVCVLYQSKVKVGVVDVKVTFKLDSKLNRVHSHNVFGESCSGEVTECVVSLPRRNQSSCFTISVLLPVMKDHTKGITVETNSVLLKDPRKEPGSTFCKTCPVTDPAESSHVLLEIPFSLGCKNPPVCRPNLKVDAHLTTRDTLIQGATTNATLEVAVSNSEDPAHMAEVLLTFQHEGMLLMMPSNCQSAQDRLVVTCTTVNPLNVSATQKMVFELDLTRLPDYSTQLVVNVAVRSAGQETTPSDNTALVIHPVHSLVNVHVNGLNDGMKVTIDKTTEANQTELMEVSHKYEIYSTGPSSVQEAMSTFLVPVGVVVDKKRKRLNKIVNVQVMQQSQIYPCDVNDHFEEMEETSLAAGGGNSLFEEITIGCTDNIANCVSVSCRVEDLKPDDRSRIGIHLQYQVNTTVLGLLLEDRVTKIRIETQGSITITDSALYMDTSKISDKSSSFTEFVKFKKLESPLWLLIFAVILGILLLIAVAAILRKIGFFKRQEWEKLQDMQNEVAQGNRSPPHQAKLVVTDCDTIE